MKNKTSGNFELAGPSSDLRLLLPGNRPPANSRKGVWFILVLQGEATIKIDDTLYTLHSGNLVNLTPGYLFSIHTQSPGFLFESLFFAFDFLSDFPLLLKANVSDKMGALPLLAPGAETFSLLLRYYDFMASRYRDESCQAEVIKGLLFSFILEVSRLYSGQPVELALSRKNELADGFFRLLHRYYKEERSASFYAGQLCVSDKHLLRVIREATGNTFYFWVSDFILKEAKLLLKSTGKSVTEIADELKLPNPSFFARFFRKHTGMSPMQFRKAKSG